ncbi:translation initiation factor IF-3 [bacterium]|jgi:translation initiation factor IF-3|nr:translation initiation factor IF-3 [bacterium]MBT4121729.1 translation initiation factor IF-3 [bacterium]MBT4335669.1 translation initiation factor IF-3 [bacterium]MBT4495775.1 translation initiation factor IF-3 [bacterium]MBT4763476.1 translation initiation factor IF-3 [bacterium]
MLRVRRKKVFKKDKKFFRVNDQIRIPEVMVIDENGESLGKLETHKALAIAKEKELDLVEVNPKANPSICKIQDYGQFQYQQAKKAQHQKTHAKKVEIKGVRMSYKIGAHDLDFKRKQVDKFLKKGNKIKIETILRGRERQYTREAIEKINQFIESLDIEVIVESPIKKQGARISTIIAPGSKE